jgi:hypothetical protein
MPSLPRQRLRRRPSAHGFRHADASEGSAPVGGRRDGVSGAKLHSSRVSAAHCGYQSRHRPECRYSGFRTSLRLRPHKGCGEAVGGRNVFRGLLRPQFRAMAACTQTKRARMVPKVRRAEFPKRVARAVRPGQVASGRSKETPPRPRRTSASGSPCGRRRGEMRRGSTGRPLACLDLPVRGWKSGYVAPARAAADRSTSRDHVLRSLRLAHALRCCCRARYSKRRVAAPKRVGRPRDAETAAVTYKAFGACVGTATANRFGLPVLSMEASVLRDATTVLPADRRQLPRRITLCDLSGDREYDSGRRGSCAACGRCAYPWHSSADAMGARVGTFSFSAFQGVTRAKLFSLRLLRPDGRFDDWRVPRIDR